MNNGLRVQAISMTTRPERIDLLYWDTQVAVHEVYAGQDIEKLVTSTKPAGGGGTDVGCVFAHIDKYKLNPHVVIVLTDGYTPYPSMYGKPTLWGVITDETPPWGKIVRIRP